MTQHTCSPRRHHHDQHLVPTPCRRKVRSWSIQELLAPRCYWVHAQWHRQTHALICLTIGSLHSLPGRIQQYWLALEAAALPRISPSARHGNHPAMDAQREHTLSQPRDRLRSARSTRRPAGPCGLTPQPNLRQNRSRQELVRLHELCAEAPPGEGSHQCTPAWRHPGSELTALCIRTKLPQIEEASYPTKPRRETTGW